LTLLKYITTNLTAGVNLLYIMKIKQYEKEFMAAYKEFVSEIEKLTA
jgi:hypothetical protein